MPHTETPTQQNVNTVPKPNSALAIRATAISATGTDFFGRLQTSDQNASFDIQNVAWMGTHVVKIKLIRNPAERSVTDMYPTAESGMGGVNCGRDEKALA